MAMGAVAWSGMPWIQTGDYPGRTPQAEAKDHAQIYVYQSENK